MAVFSDRYEEALDYYILRDCPVCLYFYENQFETDLEWLRSHDYIIHTINAEEKSSFIEQLGLIISRHHSEGQWTGGLDSLDDYFFDFYDIPDNGGVVFSITNFEKIYEEDEYFSQNVLDIIADYSRQKMLFGKRMMALLLLKYQFDLPTAVHHKISTQSVGGFTPGPNLKTGGGYKEKPPVFSAKTATPEELKKFLDDLKKKS